MLSQSNFSIRDALEVLSQSRLSVGFLVPTPTGLQKSIMDAHSDLRDFMRIVGLHDYEMQPQGPEHKRIIRATLVGSTSSAATTVSLYRPKTKLGDPRIWISGLRKYAKAGDLIALVVRGGVLHVVNVSQEEVWNSRHVDGTPLSVLLAPSEDESENLRELIDLLSEIALRGFVESLRSGPTGVGFTLETLLGIDANASKSPDFKGIEVKAHRLAKGGRKARTRTTLLSKIPDWSMSSVASAKSLLNEFGYRRDEDDRLQLYCTCSTSPNPQGLYLAHEEGVGTLHARALLAGEPGPREIVVWQLSSLQQHLAMKHRRTAWVGADVRLTSEGKENFRYRRLAVTSGPRIERFGPLVSTGDITMDFTLSEKATGRVRDHGYLFKIRPESAHLLFDPPVEYEFSDDKKRFVRLENNLA